MDYIELTVKMRPFEEYLGDVMAACLAGIGYESFVPADDGLLAYVPEDAEAEDALADVAAAFPVPGVEIRWEARRIPQRDWNEEWERNYFQPIVVGNECVIHSSFHRDVPRAKYDIVIDPKMAFGTGHHETTGLMIEELLGMELAGRRVLDMGCGTSVLAILAAMRGATDVTAIDIDPWCTDNSRDNVELNHVAGIRILLGGAELLAGERFDVILANINRNILLADMSRYAACLPSGGELYMSGFYTDDIPAIEAEAARCGMALAHTREKHRWAVVKAVKNN